MFNKNIFYTKIRMIKLNQLRNNIITNESFEIDNISGEDLKNKIFSNLDKLEEFSSFLSHEDMLKIAYCSAITYLSIWDVIDFLRFIVNPIYNFETISKLFSEFLIIITGIKIGKSFEVFDAIDNLKELFNKAKNYKGKDVDDDI